MTLKSDQELIWRVERCRVVLDLDAKERDDRHAEGCGISNAKLGI
jgi:hypothetical protein